MNKELINQSFFDTFGIYWQRLNAITKSYDNYQFHDKDFERLYNDVVEQNSDLFSVVRLNLQENSNDKNKVASTFVENLFVCYFSNRDHIFGAENVLSIFSFLPLPVRVSILKQLRRNGINNLFLIDKLAKAYVKCNRFNDAMDFLNEERKSNSIDEEFYESEKEQILALNNGLNGEKTANQFEGQNEYDIIYIPPVYSHNSFDPSTVMPYFVEWYNEYKEKYSIFIDLFFLMMMIDPRSYLADAEMEKNDEQDLEEYNQKSSISEPFDPQLVDIISLPMVISNIVARLDNKEIIIDPDYQRNPLIWNDEKQSRLIESMIIKIPLPSFYFDSTSDDRYIVVDGLQRLCAIQRFMCKEPLKGKLQLTNLEYLKQFNGKTFEGLPSNIQRRIQETTIQTFVIRPGTPDRVRDSIFNRINTGGLHLEPPEIKNAVYHGKASRLLKELSQNEDFLTATRHSIKTERMLDREYINRFLAFYVLGVDAYKGYLDSFLSEVLSKLNKSNDQTIDEYSKAFCKSMKASVELFSKNAFRKITKTGSYLKINKPLFDAVSTNLAHLSENDIQILFEKKNEFLNKYYELLQDDVFKKAISNATATVDNVKLRHDKIKQIIEATIYD